tara:strand:+ start:237 stop:923 length:687 start_codon:yes stop_codon:yes gene_type:complete
MDSDLKLLVIAVVFILILVVFYLIDKYTSEPSKNKNNKVKESVKKGSTATEEWVKSGGDMTEMMKEMAEESGATDMSEKEKEEINKKDFGKLTKTQIKDRQVYAAVRAYAELMKVDGEMHPNEMLLLGKFSEKEQKKLSKDYSQESEEFKFVWAKEENIFTCLKTYNKRQIKSFFNDLFAIAAIDGDMAESEISFICNFYANITGVNQEDAANKIVGMFGIWRAENNV